MKDSTATNSIITHSLTVYFQVAAEISAPLTKCKKVTMVSSGKGDVGALKLTNEVMNIMEKLPTVVENLTGINITRVSNCSVNTKTASVYCIICRFSARTVI